MAQKLRSHSLSAVLALAVAARCGDSAEDTTTTAGEETTTTTEADMASTTEAMMDDTVLDVAAGNEDFSTLVAAVEAAGLQDAWQTRTRH